MNKHEKAETLLKLAVRLLQDAEDNQHSSHTEEAIAYLLDDVLPNVRLAMNEERDTGYLSPRQSARNIVGDFETFTRGGV